MKRLLKIYRMMLSQNIKALMEYRIDFIIGALSFMIDQAVGIGFIFIIPKIMYLNYIDLI